MRSRHTPAKWKLIPKEDFLRVVAETGSVRGACVKLGIPTGSRPDVRRFFGVPKRTKKKQFIPKWLKKLEDYDG